MYKEELILRKIKDIIPESTSHGVGLKKVLLSNNETDSPVTQIAITTLEEGENVEIHSHPSMTEHFFILDGECIFNILENHVTCGGGTYVLIPCGTPHGIRVLKLATILTIGIADAD